MRIHVFSNSTEVFIEKTVGRNYLTAFYRSIIFSRWGWKWSHIHAACLLCSVQTEVNSRQQELAQFYILLMNKKRPEQLWKFTAAGWPSFCLLLTTSAFPALKFCWHLRILSSAIKTRPPPSHPKFAHPKRQLYRSFLTEYGTVQVYDISVFFFILELSGLRRRFSAISVL